MKIPDDLMREMEINLAIDLHDILSYMQSWLKQGNTSIPLFITQDLMERMETIIKNSKNTKD